MSGKTTKNLDRVRRLLEDAGRVASGGDVPAAREWSERARLAVAIVYGDDSPQVERFNQIKFKPTASWVTAAQAAASGVGEARAMLGAMVEDIAEHLVAPEGQGPDPSGMHPWVADAAAGLWNDGYRRQAVQNAAAAVEQRLKLKLDVHSGSASSIVATAFSTKDATPDSPRLRFADFDPPRSESWNNAHDGAVAFGRGCFMRVRNLYTHNNGANEQEDREALAAFSLLARWIDEAHVVRHGEAVPSASPVAR